MTSFSQTIRLTITPEVGRALKHAKQIYPTLSDPEILKLGLAKIVTSQEPLAPLGERANIRQTAAYSMGYDYLDDPAEEGYTLAIGEKVNF